MRRVPSSPPIPAPLLLARNPTLITLLEDIEASRVDVVVVYKVDRLSRSLLDFARLIETFDHKEGSRREGSWWEKASLRKLLTNPVYLGKLRERFSGASVIAPVLSTLRRSLPARVLNRCPPLPPEDTPLCPPVPRSVCEQAENRARPSEVSPKCADFSAESAEQVRSSGDAALSNASQPMFYPTGGVAPQGTPI